MMENVKMYTEEQIIQLKIKADKWDALYLNIAKRYPDYDDDGQEVHTEYSEDADFETIGEIAALAFGFI